jgi:valyl-tRNA synthetase
VLAFEPTANASAVTAPLDRAMLADLAETVRQATAAFEDYNYTRALELAETFFWSFTDDYVELVKDRAYGGQGPEGAASAKAALAIALDVQLRLFAPFLPFVTEEVWSWWQEGSVHRAAWPSADEALAMAGDGDRAVVADTAIALSLVRKAKSEAKASMKAEVSRAVVSGPEASMARLAAIAGDLKATGAIAELTFTPGGDAISVDVTLA